ncbi:MAG: AMP-binding protein [Candidatus Omnitrophica bacterium]|nr:AMP-binding protein [Candidatus Omnitrophota bacterium]
MLIHELLTQSAKKNPDQPAVVHQQKRMTYSRLNDVSVVFAQVLRAKNVKNGGRVALFLDNSCEYVAAYFAVLRCGAAVVPLNSQYVARELAVILADCTPGLIITDTKHLPIVKESLASIAMRMECLCVDEFFKNEDLSSSRLSSVVSRPSVSAPSSVDPCSLEPVACSIFPRPSSVACRPSVSDPSSIGLCGLQPVACSDTALALIIYTSGTTGKPKGVMLSHANVTANAQSIVAYLKLTEQDRTMVVLPFYYSYGHSLLTTHVLTGSTMVLDNRFIFPNTVLDAMRDQSVTGFAGVPSHFAILLNKSALAQYSLPSLRYVTQAGGAMPPALIERFTAMFPAVKFYVMYGQTEAAARLSYLEPEDLPRKRGSIGKAIPGVELCLRSESGQPVAVGEVGEIVARGANVMIGYWNAPEETARVVRDGSLFTGDLARQDEEGFFYIVSRKKDMIKSGANRISPLEIEEVVAQLAGVVESAAVGIPDEILGEAIALFVVAAGAVTVPEIMRHCKQNLAAYKIPKRVEFIEQLPKTASGKVKREELKEKLQAVRTDGR